jgi:sulfide:quinone oxidoreductase
MAKIVIVGAGIGGIPMALEMKEMSRKKLDEMVVIADKPTFYFVPSNPWVGVNWRKPDDIKVPLAPMFKKKKSTFIQQKGVKVNRFGNGMAYLPVL